MGTGERVEERIGEAFELGEQLTVIGRQLRPGDPAPEFTLDHFDGSAVRTVRLADSAGKVRLLHTVNSLFTPVCHVETRRWEELRAGLPPGVEGYTGSMDLPFALKRFCGAAQAGKIQALSDHREASFGKAYGVLIKELRLLARAVLRTERS